MIGEKISKSKSFGVTKLNKRNSSLTQNRVGIS